MRYLTPTEYELRRARRVMVGAIVFVLLCGLIAMSGGCTPMSRQQMLLGVSSGTRGAIMGSEDEQQTAKEIIKIANRVKVEADTALTVGDLREIVTREIINRIEPKRRRVRVMLGAGFLFDYAELFHGLDPVIIPEERLLNLRKFLKDGADRAIWVAKPIAELE